MRRIMIVGGALLWAVVSVTGQTSGTLTNSNSNSLDGNSPSDNLRSAASRRPGLMIQAATARHRALINDRVNTPQDSNTNSNTGAGTVGSGTTADFGGTNLGGLGDLTGLLSLFGGTDLASLLGSFTGGVGGTTNATSNTAPEGSTGTTTGNDATTDTSADALENFTPANGTEFTVEDLIRLRDTTAGTSKLINQAQTSQPTTDRSFKLRLADRLVTTTFTALNAALRTRPVIDAFKNGLRPLFPGASDDDNDNGNGNSNSNTNSSNGDNGVDDSIDDVPAPSSSLRF